MVENLLVRAELLIQQNKWVEAKKVLSEVISQEPDNPHILALMSEVHYQLNEHKKAKELIENAISLDPDSDHLFYVKARVMLQLDDYDEAENCLKIAVEKNPEDADYYALWASVKLARKKYKKAYKLANKALELDSENILGLNTRSTALLKLNKSEESFNTIEDALKEDPNNAYTHANYGWNLLEKGDNKKALHHFGEALKNDPNFEYAQAGMGQALKARYFVYKLFLKYAFWMSNLTAKYQWGVIIGFYFLFKFLKNLASNNETLQPFLIPVLVVLFLMAFSTWVITPIANLFLRLNKYGKHLLDKKEIMSSNFVGGSVLLLTIGGLGYLFSGTSFFLSLAVFGFVMMVPFSVMLSPQRFKYSLLIYAIAMFIIGVISIGHTFNTGELFSFYSTIFIFGFVGFQWIANFLIIRESNV